MCWWEPSSVSSVSELRTSSSLTTSVVRSVAEGIWSHYEASTWTDFDGTRKSGGCILFPSTAFAASSIKLFAANDCFSCTSQTFLLFCTMRPMRKSRARWPVLRQTRLRAAKICLAPPCQFRGQSCEESRTPRLFVPRAKRKFLDIRGNALSDTKETLWYLS